jgi:hypothetical protein
MDQGPLVGEELNAGARFLAEFNKRVPVQAAFWLKLRDEPYWYLHVASDQINDSNTRKMYGEVNRVATEMQDPWFDQMRVKLVGTDDEFARAVMDLQRKYPRKLPTRHYSYLGRLSIDAAWVYPIPVVEASQPVSSS